MNEDLEGQYGRNLEGMTREQVARDDATMRRCDGATERLSVGRLALRSRGTDAQVGRVGLVWRD